MERASDQTSGSAGADAARVTAGVAEAAGPAGEAEPRPAEAVAGLPAGAASDLVEEVLGIAGHDVRMLRPRDSNALLDELLTEDDPDDARLPFWAELWPSGAALARVLAGLPLAGARVLELGCGLGLVGIGAALAGAEVLAVDRSPEAVAFAEVNARRNGVSLRTAVCSFGEPAPLLDEAPWDLVVAADVLYDAANVPVLLWLLPRLTGDAGTVWLADPERRMAATFLTGMEASGWRRERVPADPPAVAVHRFDRPTG